MEIVKENGTVRRDVLGVVSSKSAHGVSWVQGSPFLANRASTYVAPQGALCKVIPLEAARRINRKTRAPAILMNGSGEPQKREGMDPGNENPPDGSNAGKENPPDWDSSWKEYQERQENGGVFKLPPENFEEKQRDFEGERVEKLTTAWSNETGFLLGIGVIGLIGLFYGYVFATGGISHQ